MLTQIAWRNLWRNKRRTVLTALTMGLGVAFCIWMASYMGGFMKVMRGATVDRNIGHIQINHQDYPETQNPYDVVPKAQSIIEALGQNTQVKTVAPRVQAYAMFAGDDDKAAPGKLIGVDIAAEAKMTEFDQRIEDGTWLKAPGQAVIGRELADKTNIKVGGKLLVVGTALDGSIANQVYPVVGIYSTGNVAVDGGAVLPLATAQELLVLDGGVHEVVVVTHDFSRIEKTKADLASQWNELSVRSWSEIAPDLVQMEGMISASSLIMVGIIMFLTGFMIINTLLMSVYERTREFGLLISLGLQPPKIIQMILLESGLLGLVSCLFGLALGWCAHMGMVHIGFPLEVEDGKGFVFNGVTLDPVVYGSLDPGALVLPLMAVMITALLGGIWPAMRASRLDPVVALAQE
jgi:ABC-type lipoprotein release transport system permease subunit